MTNNKIKKMKATHSAVHKYINQEKKLKPLQAFPAHLRSFGTNTYNTSAYLTLFFTHHTPRPSPTLALPRPLSSTSSLNLPHLIQQLHRTTVKNKVTSSTSSSWITCQPRPHLGKSAQVLLSGHLGHLHTNTQTVRETHSTSCCLNVSMAFKEEAEHTHTQK